jgi:hypothetical protein
VWWSLKKLCLEPASWSRTARRFPFKTVVLLRMLLFGGSQGMFIFI